MKTKLLSAILLGAVITGATLGATVLADSAKDGYISVSTTMSKDISPDTAEIYIAVETSDKSLQKATADNKLIAEKVYSTLKSMLGVSDYIKTTNFKATPVYTYNSKDQKRIFDKYVVSNEVVVKTKDMTAVPKLVDTAIANGATKVNNLKFTVGEYESYCNGMLAETTQAAQRRANVIANSIGAKVSAIKSIDSRCSADSGERLYSFNMTAAVKDEAASGSSTPISAGKIKLQAETNADFYVK